MCAACACMRCVHSVLSKYGVLCIIDMLMGLCKDARGGDLCRKQQRGPNTIVWALQTFETMNLPRSHNALLTHCDPCSKLDISAGLVGQRTYSLLWPAFWTCNLHSSADRPGQVRCLVGPFLLGRALSQPVTASGRALEWPGIALGWPLSHCCYRSLPFPSNPYWNWNPAQAH